MSVSRYSKNPNCFDCGKRKGVNQVNKLRCFRCQKIAERKQRQSSHERHINLTYGITGAEYKQLLGYQAGKCAICCRATGRSRRLAVDHDHSCKEGHPPKYGCPECVRGLLCYLCNDYIGKMHDDPKVGERMARYLREPPWSKLRSRLQISI